MLMPAFLSSKNQAPESQTGQTYLFIVLSSQSVQSALWQVEHGQTHLLAQSAQYQYQDAKSCVVKTDESLQDLGKASENVSQVIFGLPPSWVKTTGLADEHKPLLQKLTKDLSLNPLGYVVSHEAIARYQALSQPAQRWLLIDVTPATIDAVLVDQALVSDHKQVGRSEEIALDIQEALARFQATAMALPPHLVLSSTELSDPELEQVYQSLLEYDWSASEYFDQQPYWQVMPQSQVLQALIQAGAQALGAPTSAVAAPAAAPESAVSVEPGGPSSTAAHAPSYGQERAVTMPAETEPESAPTPAPSKNPLKRLLASPWWQKHKTAVLGGAAAGLLATIAVLFGSLWWMRQVVVMIQPVEKRVAQDVTITLSPEATVSEPENLILKAEKVTQEVSDSQTVSTSGIKLVGDAATGEVTLFNKTDSVKTFDQGTRLQAGELAFTLDETVSVASASSQENSSGDGETKSYGKATVKVTATEIGAESNLAKDTEFQIVDFAKGTFSASANEAFTGGSSREIRVVSQEDRDELLALLEQSILQKAEKQYQEQAGSGQFYALTGSTEVSDAVWSAEVGEEKRELALDLTLSVEALAYTSDDLKSLAQVVLADEVPPGFTLTDEDPELLSQPTTKDDALVLEANISAPVRAEISAEAIAQSISGQPLTQAQSTLLGNELVAQAALSQRPGIAGWFFRSVPQALEKIKVTVVTSAEADNG